ncbi:hypothetical protein LRS74_00160 [Streptomyces sp. LX-29]|uniref:hypothetical protein n=1 Tax=Streptomyces sp. LX-29 TaxID=2900152 RepID=UPI00240CFEAA|nr:hypothetical protein [Streptomyces sp. LX-29]WFB05607.1 hypothetical protein LRS74_00160 [Streptomyces sp. LX-29]
MVQQVPPSCGEGHRPPQRIGGARFDDRALLADLAEHLEQRVQRRLCGGFGVVAFSEVVTAPQF